jgi:hypothetical protein
VGQQLTGEGFPAIGPPGSRTLSMAVGQPDLHRLPLLGGFAPYRQKQVDLDHRNGGGEADQNGGAQADRPAVLPAIERSARWRPR